MKERPILFSAPMVRALLDGTKTQTRRVVKSHRNSGDFIIAEGPGGSLLPYHSFDGESMDATGNGEEITIDCPYGQPGDRLWVKETFGIWHRADATPVRGQPYDPVVIFRADDEGYVPDIPKFAEAEPWRWRPSIHMFRRDSRITLEITAVRVERLQNISEADAKAEGADASHAFFEDGGQKVPFPYRGAYASLWESINGPGSWALNPWVWVVEFKVVK